MTHVATEPPTSFGGAPSEPEAPHLGWAVAGLSAGAGVIHFAMVPTHAGGASLLDPLGFAAVGWFQLVVAAVILSGRARSRTYQVAVVGNLAALGLWVWSRTAGLPFGNHADVVEDVGAIDAAAAAMEVGVVLLSARILLAPARSSVGRLAPALVAVAALGLTTTVITSTDASEHGGDGHGHESAGAAADDDHHGTGTTDDGHATLMAAIDADRCDTEFNIDAYWDETAYLGVDTYQGGAMATTEAAHGHDSSSGDAPATTTTEPDPTAGRGSIVLDSLVSATSLSSGGEGAAARLVSELGDASEEDYEAWLWWLRSSGTVGGGHGHDAASPGDSGGHGGHAGPQPWVALTDQADCDQLAAELETAREVALRYPTAQDAMDAGWVRVTGYVPGIAAHYMKFPSVDGEFHLEEPEMILYDGNGPDAHVVGLSYYLLHDGDAEPTQGFTGANDHGHRHIGLCVGQGGVIGDSTTTEEECAQRGGVKSSGSNAWMSHAWVVPGCESPWGVFSAASPVLDGQLGDESGTNDGGCSASAVRDRYGLDGIAAAQSGGD